MAKKIIDTGKTARRVEATDRAARRIEPEAFAAALGAEPVAEAHVPNLDPLSLAAVGSELLKRLRSTGGRPALIDATEMCRVPLSPTDVTALEKLTRQIEQQTGAKPSVGQFVSVIVHHYLTASQQPHTTAIPKGLPPDAITSLLPALAEIVRNAEAVQESAHAIESAVKAIKEEDDRLTR